MKIIIKIVRLFLLLFFSLYFIVVFLLIYNYFFLIDTNIYYGENNKWVYYYSNKDGGNNKSLFIINPVFLNVGCKTYLDTSLCKDDIDNIKEHGVFLQVDKIYTEFDKLPKEQKILFKKLQDTVDIESNNLNDIGNHLYELY